ncbi:hypothetical protein TNCV_4459841 [Trichonephila clavipes]|nr:hypothetical protein TNCV_4459841 [Trichonephila clavipes]
MSYDYAACKRFFECLFGLGSLGKTLFLSAVSHRQSSGASLWGRNWTPKSLARRLVFQLYGAAREIDASSRRTY